MILAGLPRDLAEKLQANQVDDDRPRLEEHDEELDEQRLIHSETVFWDVNEELSFAISYRKGKMFKVGRISKEHYIETPIKDPERARVYIEHGLMPVTRKIDYLDDGPTVVNDVIGFFQMRFVEALELMQIEHTPKELKILKEGKANRNRMAKLPLLQVMEYQKQELIDLCRMMNKLRECFEKLGIEITRWQGAGALAEAIFKKFHLKDYLPRLEVSWDNMPPQQQWAHYGYFGGHIEQFHQGRFSPEEAKLRSDALSSTCIFSYDINSAYPHVLRYQPAMMTRETSSTTSGGTRSDRAGEPGNGFRPKSAHGKRSKPRLRCRCSRLNGSFPQRMLCFFLFLIEARTNGFIFRPKDAAGFTKRKF
jgi:DNA polymerase type B, organellar and viral